ncbi:Trypsin Inhibitor-like cysteine rich domain, partial [Trinorchestia longiramus]
RCATSAPPTAPCPMPQCQDGYEINFADTKELLKPCPAFECIPLVTTTVCPPVECAPGLRTMFLSTSESGCPQYTCLKITTPAIAITPMPTVAPCAEVALPVCEPGEEFYQKNPNDPCPEFGCKPIGEPVPTTGAPQVASPECEMDGKAFSTFDGTDFKLDTCNHILARDKTNEDWLISVHRNCTQEGSCSRYLKVKQEEHQMLLNPDLTIEWDSASYSVSQMQKIGSQSKTFSVSRQGDSLYLQSLRHGFYFVWDVNMNLKIGVDDELLNQVDGLCGFYTGDPSDDKTKPDGSPATNTEEYGDSWTLGEDKCEETRCDPDITAAAFQFCNSIDAKPFSECHAAVPPSTFLQGCIERTCKCLADGGTEEECKCAALSRYVTNCLTLDNSIPVQDWRVIARCYKECPPGERYSDCHNSCENTCDSLKLECPKVQSAICSAGCFCDPGLVRKDGRCVHPDMCGDCTCEGYGDPHYKSFDRRNFTFNGECSYIAARHRDPRGNHKFQVITHNKRCNRDPITMCTDSVKILHSDREVEVKLLPTGAILSLVEGAPLSDFPYRDEHFAVERPDEKHVAVAVPALHLEVTYSAENYGFTITVPSHQFSNETEGLCGNCNGDPKDDQQLTTGGQAVSVEDFGLSWQVAAESPGVCEIFRKEDSPCLPLPPDVDPCLKIMDPEIFGQCHPLEDPVAYVSSCQQDVCLSTDPDEAACQSLSAYAKRCAQLGSCLQWNREDFCPVTCPSGQRYEVCGPGCVLTCDNYEEYEQNPDSCPFSSTDGCYCPSDQVLLNGTCVEKAECTPCDEEGHRQGDTWNTDTCTTCQCSNGRVLCTSKSCPQDPICDKGYNLIELPYAEDECCGPPKKCILAPPSSCPPVKEPVEPCGHGKTYQLIQSGRCREFVCVCLTPEECPTLLPPDPAQLQPGEEWELNDQGCCPRHVKVCTGDCPQLQCQEFYEVITQPPGDGACCPTQTCG